MAVPEMCSEILIQLFNELFIPSAHTRLQGGAEEPIYFPSGDARQHNEIHFTRDYCASAMHEIAHWCVAGAERRRLVDFGYWYARTDELCSSRANLSRWKSNRRPWSGFFPWRPECDFA